MASNLFRRAAKWSVNSSQRVALMRSLPLIALLASLMILPREVFASPHVSLGLGVGYVRGECLAADDGKDDSCFEGTRVEASLGLFHREAKDPPKTPTAVASSSDSSSSGWNWFPTNGGGTDVVLVVLALILIVYGIYWLVAAIASKKLKLGLFYSQDFQATTWKDRDGKDYESYDVQRYGMQASFYFFESVDIQLHAGVGPAAAQLSTHVGGVTESYSMQGLSTKAGIGYVPFDGKGLFLFYEVEGTFFEESSLKHYVESNTETNLPKVRRSGAVMTGWNVAF